MKQKERQQKPRKNSAETEIRRLRNTSLVGLCFSRHLSLTRCQALGHKWVVSSYCCCRCILHRCTIFHFSQGLIGCGDRFLHWITLGYYFPEFPGWLSLTTSKTESFNFNIATALTFSFANPVIRIHCSVIAVGFFNLISSVTLWPGPHLSSQPRETIASRESGHSWRREVNSLPPGFQKQVYRCNVRKNI